MRAGKHAADQHAERIHRQQARQRHIGDRRRRSVQRAERHDEIGVEPAAHDRDQNEEREIEQDRRRHQEPPAGVGGTSSLAVLAGWPGSTAGSGCAITTNKTTSPKIAAPI